MLQNPNNTLDMDFINETYIRILIENDTDPEGISNDYKKQLKQLICMNLPDLAFVKGTQNNKSEQLIVPSTQANVLHVHPISIAEERDICS